MKKSILLALFVAIFGMSASANTDQDFLREIVNELNSKLPSAEEDGMQMQSITYANNTIVYLFYCNENVLDNDFIAVLNENSDDFKAELKQTFLGDDPDIEAFKQTIKAAQASVTFKFKGVPSGEVFAIRFNYTEL